MAQEARAGARHLHVGRPRISASDGEMAIDDQRGTLGTVRNAALLLEFLSEGPAYHHLTDLADRAGMSLPTVHRLLRSLVAAGLVEQDPRSARYGLGPQLVYLSERYLSRLGVVNAAAPYLVELRDSLEATVRVGVLVRSHVVYVDRVDAEHAGGPFRESERMRHAFDTAAGRLLIARAGTEAWRRAEDVLQDGVKRPSASQRQSWSRASYLISESDGLAGAFEVAVPIATGGAVLAALAASAAATQHDERTLKKNVAPHLERAAQAIARTVGHA
jgi:IclR family transcriptional regulator, acetate operon repressor